MNIHIQWADSAHTSLLLRFERGWTWDELKLALQEADALILSAPHTVHLIIDLRQAGGLPRDFLSAANELFAQGEARANEGMRIVVGAGMLLRVAYKSLVMVFAGELANRPFHFAGSLDEAQAIVANSSPT